MFDIMTKELKVVWNFSKKSSVSVRECFPNNIATGKISQAITPFNLFNFYH